ncbi:hypothetical protein [Lacisediminihabitans profunda]|uniref:Fibronectin type-III domain-containing protein n=1 Tax=Lacisediminihabitans profunda TaxID=2594790 RepID=A0A5C8UQJ3_9MICO|nr:hypothetical protein [Lacisediminihabitans profunda]TXN29739.1 hypothetical protein FVP33_11345 [Lacisediminihabitans profunda]
MRFSRQALITAAASVVAASILSFAAPSALAAWTASGSASFTQSAPTVPTATFVSCVTDKSKKNALLTWSAAPPTFNGSAFSSYLIEWFYNNGTAITTSSSATPVATLAGQGLAGNSTVRVTVRYSNGSTSTAPAIYPFVLSNNGLLSPQCSPDF